MMIFAISGLYNLITNILQEKCRIIEISVGNTIE
jgi:hypothetical protein